MGKKMSLKALFLAGAVVAVVLTSGWKTVEYTSSDAFCVTCHVMQPKQESAYHTFHRAPQVTCRDCHLPQDNVVKMLGYKAYSGAKDVYSNLVGPPDHIRTTATSQSIIEANCIRCHQTTVQNIETSRGMQCFECHREIPHGN